MPIPEKPLKVKREKPAEADVGASSVDRYPYGPVNPELWESIWHDYSMTDMRLKDICAKYEVCPRTIYDIGKRLGHGYWRRGRGCWTGPVRLLSDDEERRLVAEYQKGELSIPKLRAKYGITEPQLYEAVDRAAGAVRGSRRRPFAKRRPPRYSRQTMEEIWQLYAETDESVDHICWTFNIDKSTLYDIGDYLGRTDRRHKSAAGAAVLKRKRLYKTQKMPH